MMMFGSRSTTETDPTDASGGNVDEAAAKPSTMTVIGLLALTSLTFSYLGAYAVSGALVRSEVLKHWPADHDPRPRWLALGFFVLLTCFLAVGGLVRFLSKRQLRQIDEMSDETAA
jgi:hypothetical protein